MRIRDNIDQLIRKVCKIRTHRCIDRFHIHSFQTSNSSLIFNRFFRKRRKSLKLSKRPSYLEVIPLTPTVASTNNLSALTGDANLTLQSNAGKSRTSAYLYSVPNEPDSWRVPVENFEEYVKNAVSSAQLNSQFKVGNLFTDIYRYTWLRTTFPCLSIQRVRSNNQLTIYFS